MPDLLGNEQPGVAVLDQMGHIRVPQAMQAQMLVKAEIDPRLSEEIVDLSDFHAGAALGQPECRVRACLVERQRFLDPLFEALDGPVELGNREHRPPARQRPCSRFAVAHMHRLVRTPGQHVRVRAQVRNIQVRELVAAQPERIRCFEHGSIPQRCQRTLASRTCDPIHPLIEPVEQRLQLAIHQWAPLGPALVVIEMGHSVPLVANLRGNLPERS